MKSINTTLILFLSIAQLIVAQNSSITIFSQEGEKFYVIVDGVRQNDLPMTNVKVTDLDRPLYKVKVIFEDGTLEDIDKSVFLQDVDGNAMNLVYNIAPNRKGKLVMRISSFSEATNESVNQENVVKYHPKENPIQKQDQQITTTTTTTTTKPVTSQNGISINMGVGTGVNTTLTEDAENVTINLNVGGLNTNGEVVTTTQQTTTTTVSTTASSNLNNTFEEKGCLDAMDRTTFSTARSSVEKQSFSETKMKTAKQLAKANCLSVNQIKQIMELFSFDDDKLEFAKFAYPYCIDKNNYFMLAEVFSFSSNADDLNDFIDKN